MATTSTTIFGTLPNNATKRDSSSQNKFLMGISYPLAKSRSKKVFGDIKDVVNVKYFTQAVNKELIVGMLRQLFLTKKGERIMNPSFGLDLKEYIFSPLDLTTFEIMRGEILSQIRIFAPFLEIIRLNIFEANSSIADNGLIVKLTCKIRDINLIPPFSVEVNIG
jgi:phage baseplate assembly protein W|tara:strand:- start:56 stop:550 length:495 start_codon:yes stop_codon:yes gene_type:complete